MESPHDLAQMDAERLRDLAATLIAQVTERDAQIAQHSAALTARDAQLAKRDEELRYKQLKIDQLTHEMATLKRWQYGRRSEQLDDLQRSLLDDSIDADIAAIELEIEALQDKAPAAPKSKPRRVPLPAAFPRRDVMHEPEQTQCSCGCRLERIGEDLSEKLNYTPGVFTVEHHVRGKWVCRGCETLRQAAVPPHIIDKGIPTAGLLAQVLIAKYCECRYRHLQYHAAPGTMPQNSVAGSKTSRVTRVYSVEGSA